MRLLKKSDIPNVLTVFRICLVPIFVYLFLISENHNAALAVFFLAGITDVVDGITARRFGWMSDIGKILDPFADKCMQISALVCLGIGGFVPIWIVVILVLKETVLLVGATVALKKEKVYIQSNWYGKAGTIAFYIVITLLVIFDNMYETARLCLGVSLILFMLFALTMYIVNYRKNILRSNVELEK